MQTIALPNKTSFKPGPDVNKGQIIIEPCFPGYGITLGNSIRRVLLSSLPGAAVVGVKIEGVQHEFMTLANLKEDILEFVLNLKMLRLKIFSDEIIKLELKVPGKNNITAADISKNSEVEIVNPKLKLGNITDMSGALNAEIFVSKGMGYETIENREKIREKETGYIEMDSIFSPILSVGVTVENIRVGKMTNWDKLLINITTDGSITPQEAFEKSVKILIEQFSSLSFHDDTKENKNGVEKIEDSKEIKAEAEDFNIEDKDKEDEEDMPKKKAGRPKKKE